MFNLKTSAPETYRLSIRLSAELEGPSVARIFVERFLFIDEEFQVAEDFVRKRRGIEAGRR
jgi:hypothetical protein